MLQAKSGKHSVLDVSESVKQVPSGGCVYIYNNSAQPYRWKDGDGYRWSQILHQIDLVTSRGNKMDYYHFYIDLAREGEKKRTSPNFRKEAYKLGHYTLVAYIGDASISGRQVEKQAEVEKQKTETLERQKQAETLPDSRQRQPENTNTQSLDRQRNKVNTQSLERQRPTANTQSLDRQRHGSSTHSLDRSGLI